MFLNPSDKIQAFLAATVTTNDVVYFTSWCDENGTTHAFVGDNKDGTISGATPVDIVSTPASGHTFQVEYISIYNADTVNATVTIQHYDGSSGHVEFKVTLKPLETWQYSYPGGPSALVNGAKASGEAGVIVPDQTVRFMMSGPGNIAASQSAISAGTTPTGHAPYWGIAAYGYTQVVVEYEVSLAGGTVTWAEIGLFVGRPVLTSSTGWIYYLRPVAYVDVAAAVAALGIKSTTMTIDAGKVKAGDHLWLGFAATVSAGNNAQIRGQPVEAFQVGFSAAFAFRPSLGLEEQRRMTVDTGVPPWLCCQFS